MIHWLALALGVAQPVAAEPPPSPDAAALIANCEAHKFETTVIVTVEGKLKPSKVKLCGKVGQSDADWLTTLQDAVAKVAANDKMSPSMKQQITVALNAEIANVKTQIAASAAPRPVANLPPPTNPALVVRPPEYATLPPMPTAPTVATPRLLASPAAPVARPRMTIRCLTPGDLAGEAPCLTLERDTLLTVRADENLAPGLALRFMRKGDERGELALAQLPKGRSVRLRLPAELCRGVSGSRVTIEVLSRGAVADSLGPYDLRC
jgi:hypothetical protein